MKKKKIKRKKIEYEIYSIPKPTFLQELLKDYFFLLINTLVLIYIVRIIIKYISNTLYFSDILITYSILMIYNDIMNYN